MNRSYAVLAAALTVPALLAPAALAYDGGSGTGRPTQSQGGQSQGAQAQGTEVFRTKLMELNNSGATGKVQMQLRGTELTIRIKARGLLPNAVHVQHIHGEGNSECPTMKAADTDPRDGVLTTPEGLPFYGPIATSLTVKGDTSPAAGLTLELMPVADDKGRIDYRRTLTLPKDVAEDLEDYQIVQHGVDLNGSGGYDGPLDEVLVPATGPVPLEATVPANCGTISPAGDGHGHEH